MIDTGDINKMEMKDTKMKKTEGVVYGTKQGHTDFHSLESMIIASRDKKSLKEILDTIDSMLEDDKQKIQILKDVMLEFDERLKKAENIISIYIGNGGE